MHWTHRQRQGWLVVGLGAALMGGCGAPADQGVGFGAELPARAELPAGQRLTFADVADLPPLQAAVDAMPLLPGGNVSQIPLVRPEEQSAAMPGAGARLKK